MLRPAPTRTYAQRLAQVLPECWQRLATLPEPICEALLTLAVANQGGGWDALLANAKLKHLATLSTTEIETAFAQRAQA